MIVSYNFRKSFSASFLTSLSAPLCTKCLPKHLPTRLMSTLFVKYDTSIANGTGIIYIPSTYDTYSSPVLVYLLSNLHQHCEKLIILLEILTFN